MSQSSGSSKVVNVDGIILNVYLNYSYQELEDLVEELMGPDKHLNSVSVLHQYVLESTAMPIDMGNQIKRNRYQPNLFTRKNDAFGLWNFNYLVNLLELDYEYAGTNGTNFPKIWKTTSTTTVQVKKISKNTQQQQQRQDDGDLLGLLKVICRQNKYCESEASLWQISLEGQNIGTIEHLRMAIADDSCWKELLLDQPLLKQMLKDYIQLKATRHTNYDDSKATLLSDIHRVRRYFHHRTNTLKHIAYLDPEAVRRAMDEIRVTHDDDGNLLDNIHAYLRTFCLKNTMATADEHAQQHQLWIQEQDRLHNINETRRVTVDALQELHLKTRGDVESYELALKTIIEDENEVEEQTEEFRNNCNTKRNTAKVQLEKAFENLVKYTESYQVLTTEIADDGARIRNLDVFVKLDLTEEHRKLTIKYGRGLLLYGPPGTGKSELLKRIAISAGITMTTPPFSAGEVNRSAVGETEKLLVDIMSRANTIPYLICAMTIDEIDGLVPKRDFSNTQQWKVDGISILLSHIEGIKNIPNLIVFGATNRRNVMDEAFLRRIQSKCFVGRPSPQIREKMLQPLLSRGSHIFTDKHIDFLVKLTTNFSGAAVLALRSSILVAMGNYPEPGGLTNQMFLELVDTTAREFSCWFGIGTLPEIVRLYPNIFSPEDQHDRYSLKLPDSIPSGRILVDLEGRKCFIELINKQTLEKKLDDEETSTLTLLSRFINGCFTRNIHTVQLIDLNFLTKQNAFEEKEIFESLTNLFLECDEYNRSMLIFDIDSLITLESQMSQTPSISNMRLYQFIRQKCNTATVQQQSKEKWIVIIVRHPFLRRLLVDDIGFQKTPQQMQQERDDQSVKKCPKCRQNYIPSQVTYGNCRYHDGFIFDFDQRSKLTHYQAQTMVQKEKLLANTNRHNQQQQLQKPKLIWACCLGVYGIDPPCQMGICGLPDDLKNSVGQTENDATMVERHYMNNQAAQQNIDKFLETFRT